MAKCTMTVLLYCFDILWLFYDDPFQGVPNQITKLIDRFHDKFAREDDRCFIEEYNSEEDWKDGEDASS